MFCPNCGFDLPEGSKFCLSCGNKLPEIQVPKQSVEEKAEPADAEWQDAMSDLDYTDDSDDVIPLPFEEPAPEDVTIAVSRPPQFETAEYDDDNMTIAVPQPPAEEPKNSDTEENPFGVCDFDDSRHKKRAHSLSAPQKPAAWATVLSVFLSILLFFTALSATALSLVRHTFSKESISEWIDDVDLAEIDISKFSDKYSTVSEMLRDFLLSQDKWDTLSERRVELLLEKKSVKDFVEDTLVEYSEFIFEGKSGKGLTPEVIVEFIKENDGSFLSTLNPALDGFRLKFNYDDIEGMLKKNLGDKLSIRALKNNNRTAISLIQFFTSSTFNIILWVLCVVYIGLLALLNLKRIRRIFNYAGIPLFVLGVIWGMVYIVLSIRFGIDSNNIISIFITPLANGIIGLSLICLGVGIVSIFTKITIDLILQKKARKYALE